MPPDRLSDILVTRVALCKRGANPGARQVMWKIDAGVDAEPTEGAYATLVAKKDYTPAQRRQLAKEGKALPDGSWPIEDAVALKAAVLSFGRGTKPMARVKNWIVKRARALGAIDALPDAWGVKKQDPEPVTKTGRKIKGSRLERLRDLLGGFTGVVEELEDKEEPVDTIKREDLPADLPEDVTKYLDQVDAELEKAKKTAPAPDEPVAKTEEERKIAAIRKAVDETEDEGTKLVLKHSLDIAEKALTDSAEAKAESARLRIEKADDEMRGELTKSFPNTIAGDKAAELAPVLRKLKADDPDGFAKVEQAMKTAEEALRQSKIFELHGSTITGADTAYGKLEALANARLDGVKKSGGEQAATYTFEKAFSEVTEDPANAELMQQYRDERDEARR